MCVASRKQHDRIENRRLQEKLQTPVFCVVDVGDGCGRWYGFASSAAAAMMASTIATAIIIVVAVAVASIGAVILVAADRSVFFGRLLGSEHRHGEHHAEDDECRNFNQHDRHLVSDCFLSLYQKF